MVSAYNLAQLSPFAPMVERLFVHPVNAGSFAQLNALADVFGDAVESDRPQLVWSHFILPHPPVRLDRSCEAHRELWRNSQFLTKGDQDDDLRRDAYIDQTVCVNETLLQELNEILQENPDTAVFVFGDHGPDGSGQLATAPKDMTPDQIWERLSILQAVREPSGCFDASSADTLVGAARAFVSCTLGVEIDPIRDRAFLVPFQRVDVPAVEIQPLAQR